MLQHDAVFCLYRYFLRPQLDLKPSTVDLGSLRLKISYSTEHVFSSHHYDDLRNLLLQSSEIEVILPYNYKFLELNSFFFVVLIIKS